MYNLWPSYLHKIKDLIGQLHGGSFEIGVYFDRILYRDIRKDKHTKLAHPQYV